MCNRFPLLAPLFAFSLALSSVTGSLFVFGAAVPSIERLGRLRDCLLDYLQAFLARLDPLSSVRSEQPHRLPSGKASDASD